MYQEEEQKFKASYQLNRQNRHTNRRKNVKVVVFSKLFFDAKEIITQLF